MNDPVEQPNEERPEWSDEDTKPNKPVDVDDPRPKEEPLTENPPLKPPDGPPMPHNPIHPEIPPMGPELPK
jgi:hypothetical protein